MKALLQCLVVAPSFSDAAVADALGHMRIKSNVSFMATVAPRDILKWILLILNRWKGNLGVQSLHQLVASLIIDTDAVDHVSIDAPFALYSAIRSCSEEICSVFEALVQDASCCNEVLDESLAGSDINF